MDDMSAALAGMASVGSPRRPSGVAAFALGGTPRDYAGTVVPRHNAQSGDPTAPGTAVAQPQMMAQELGASYKVMPHLDRGTMEPATGPTQGNGRILNSATNRTTPNFFMSTNY